MKKITSVLALSLVLQTNLLAQKAQPLEIKWFDLPQGSMPVGITAGKDGNIWFCLEGKNEIGRMTAEGELKTFGFLKGWNTSCRFITADNNDNLWFTLIYPAGPEKIMRKTPDGKFDGSISPAFPIAKVSSAGGMHFTTISRLINEPTSITTGPDGYIYFAESISRKIWQINPNDNLSPWQLNFPNVNWNKPGEFSALLASGDYIWFADPQNNQIGRINTKGDFNFFKLSRGDNWPVSLAADSQGNIWFAEQHSNRIGYMDQKNNTTEFSLPDEFVAPQTVILGPDGNMWFTSHKSDKIGRVNTDGRIEIFSLSDQTISNQAGLIYAITADLNGNLWITQRARDGIEGDKDAIGKIRLLK